MPPRSPELSGVKEEGEQGEALLPAGLRRGRPHLPKVPERATIYLPLLPEGQGSGVPSPAPCQDPEAAGLLCLQLLGRPQ